MGVGIISARSLI